MKLSFQNINTIRRSLEQEYGSTSLFISRFRARSMEEQERGGILVDLLP